MSPLMWSLHPHENHVEPSCRQGGAGWGRKKATKCLSARPVRSLPSSFVLPEYVVKVFFHWLPLSGSQLEVQDGAVHLRGLRRHLGCMRALGFAQQNSLVAFVRSHSTQFLHATVCPFQWCKRFVDLSLHMFDPACSGRPSGQPSMPRSQGVPEAAPNSCQLVWLKPGCSFCRTEGH